uniref:Integrin alpha-11-like n=1 Tax=Gouania willdenowi TaxID=441366 RepID=A0A8C5HT40_GOUWI
MDCQHLLLLWTCSLLPDLQVGFNFDSKNIKIFSGSEEAQFGYTVQQHEAQQNQWLLVGAPFETTENMHTGDIYKCPLDVKASSNCSRINLGKISLDYMFERKDKMLLGMTLASNPRDSSFVACGPLWSHECGSSIYSTGICTRVNENFETSKIFTPALQRCETYMDIVIVLDGSNSIYPWFEVQEFLINILQTFNVGPGRTQVGVVQYGSSVVHEFSLGDYQTVAEVVQAASTITQRGGEETRTALSIKVARSEAFERGGRPGAKKVMIVITDGESHDSPELMQAVTDAKTDNITMYAIAVLGYYNRRGINPEAFLREIKLIASDPDEKHFFNVTDESALKDIVDALGERIFSLEGTSHQGRGFGLQMAQAGFSSHVVKDGVLLGAVGAYDWNGAVLKETKHGKVVPSKASYQDEFPDTLKNHAAYLGYSVGSVTALSDSQLYVAGAPRFNHTGKVIVFTLMNDGNLTILQTLHGEQIGSYFGSVLLSIDIDDDETTDFLLVAAPMFYSHGWERGRIYIYSVTPQASFVSVDVLEVTDSAQNSRLGSAMAQIPDMNGNGFKELVVGAPLEDDHQGAVYIFKGRKKNFQRHYAQRLSAAGFSAGLQYFGQSLHAVLDVNGDGLVDLAVGARGAAAIIWSQSVVRIRAKLTLEPGKVNTFNKDCQRGGKQVTCMSVSVCLSFRSNTKLKTPVAVWFSLLLDENRFPPRAYLDEAHRQQPLRLLLQPGGQNCQQLGFSVQETTDYGRPIMVVLTTGLQSPDTGMVLDPDWPTIFRSELHYWNGCEQEDTCVPDLFLHSYTDLIDLRPLCSSQTRTGRSLCSHNKSSDGAVFVVEPRRRRIVVFTRLENRGENAYRAAVRFSTSSNLVFSRLLVKDQSDVQIECHPVAILANQRSCNISSPFMRSLSKVRFRLEFEFNQLNFLDHAHIFMEAVSDGEERYPDDNINDIFLPLKYQADLLFTRDPNPPRFEIRPSSYRNQADSLFPTFNLTYSSGAGSFCSLPDPRGTRTVTVEDLSAFSQLNHSNSVSTAVQCRLSLPASAEMKVVLRGRLHIPALLAVSFRSLQIVTTASLQLEASSPIFLQEDKPVREIILDLRKEEEFFIPIWIILGSSLAGLLLLGLLVLCLWKIGFFKRSRRQIEEEQPVGAEDGQ